MSDRTGSPSEGALRLQALSSFLWSYGGLLGGKAFFFLATLVLARLLAPEDFGLVAFALAALAYINNLAIHGVGESLVYRTDARSPRVASTAYWLTIVLSLTFTAIVWLAAPLVGVLTDDDTTIWILRALSLQLVIASFASTHGYLIRHSLEFRRLFVPDQVGGAVKGGVSVGLAFGGAGVWSLVGGQLAGTLVGSTVLVLRSRWRPILAVAREEVLPTLKVGMAFTAVAILGEAARNLDFIIIGLRRGADDLGYYVLAFRLPELAVLALFEVMWSVLFPFYSRVRDAEDAGADDALARSYLRTVRLGALLSFPLGFAIAALSQPLVLTLYGDRWEPSVWPLALIAIWASFTAVAGMPGTVFKALGRPGLLTRCLVVYLALLLPSLWVSAGYGITEVAAAHVTAQAVYFVFLAFVLGRVASLPWWASLTALVPGLLVGAATGAALLPVAFLLPPVAALLAGLAVAPAAFLLAMRVVAPADLVSLRRVFESRRGRSLA